MSPVRIKVDTGSVCDPSTSVKCKTCRSRFSALWIVSLVFVWVRGILADDPQRAQRPKGPTSVGFGTAYCCIGSSRACRERFRPLFDLYRPDLRKSGRCRPDLSQPDRHRSDRFIPPCCARKRPHQGKIDESFPFLKIGTGLAHRRETLSNSDQAPGLANHWADRPQKRGSPLQRFLAQRALHWAWCPTAAAPFAGNGLSRHHTTVENTTFRLRVLARQGDPSVINSQDTRNKYMLPEPKSSTSVSMNQCVHHDHCHDMSLQPRQARHQDVRLLTLLVTPFILNSTSIQRSQHKSELLPSPAADRLVRSSDCILWQSLQSLFFFFATKVSWSVRPSHSST